MRTETAATRVHRDMKDDATTITCNLHHSSGTGSPWPCSPQQQRQQKQRQQQQQQMQLQLRDLPRLSPSKSASGRLTTRSLSFPDRRRLAGGSRGGAQVRSAVRGFVSLVVLRILVLALLRSSYAAKLPANLRPECLLGASAALHQALHDPPKFVGLLG